jgi:hypothetical protein
MRKPISLLTVIILLLLTLFVAVVQTAKAQQGSAEQLSVTISPSNATTIDVGQYLQFSAFASGGAPPYSYQWYSNGIPIPDAASSSFMFAHIQHFSNSYRFLRRSGEFKRNVGNGKHVA